VSADEPRPETPEPTRRHWLRPVALMAIPLAVVWAVAFAVTGLLWWSAADEVAQVKPPQPPALEAVDTSGIDVELYARAHPSWTP